MGDGELSGTGLEIAGWVCIRVSVCKGKRIRRPILETADAVYVIATEATFEQAVHQEQSCWAVFLFGGDAYSLSLIHI